MPRAARVVVEDAFYHIFARGNRRQTVFRDDDDRRRFLDRLFAVERTLHALHVAHCLMGNHFHLVVRPGPAGPSRLLHRVLSPYAQWFNRRHGTVGHLFQDRFGSRVLESDEALVWAVRYVHRNPVEAGLVRTAAAWRWSSHRGHIEVDPQPELAEGARWIRALLDDDPGRAIRRFDRMVNAKVGDPVAPLEPKGWVPADRAAPREEPPGPPPERRLMELAREVAGRHRLRDASSLASSSRFARVLTARRSFCFRAVVEEGLPLIAVGRFLRRSPDAVRRLARKP